MIEQTAKIRTSFICTIPSAVVTQALAQAGADTVVIDQEHGAVGPENLHAMIASTAGTNCRPVVRVGKRDEAMVKLALDFGGCRYCVSVSEYRARGFGLCRNDALSASREARLRSIHCILDGECPFKTIYQRSVARSSATS